MSLEQLSNTVTLSPPLDEDVKKEIADPSSPSDTPKKAGRRKINIEFIEDKSRRHITFSKRKAGIMKKAYELSTLTGTQVLLLVASETGHVYTFATPKLQPLITKPEGKNLIQSCLNAGDNPPPSPPHHGNRLTQSGYQENPAMMYPSSELYPEPPPAQYEKEDKERRHSRAQQDSGAKGSYPLDVNTMNMGPYSLGASNYPPAASNNSLSHLVPSHMANMYSMPAPPISSRYSNQHPHNASTANSSAPAAGSNQYAAAPTFNPAMSMLSQFQNASGYGASNNPSYMWPPQSHSTSSSSSSSEMSQSKQSVDSSHQHLSELDGGDHNISLHMNQKDS